MIFCFVEKKLDKLQVTQEYRAHETKSPRLDGVVSIPCPGVPVQTIGQKVRVEFGILRSFGVALRRRSDQGEGAGET
jgi:hypothetical protein